MRLPTTVVMVVLVAACSGDAADRPTTTTVSVITTTTEYVSPPTAAPPASTTTTVETCFVTGGSDCSDEELFLEFVLTFPYEQGGVIDGIRVGNLVESDLFEIAEIWCGSLEVMADEAGEVDPVLKATSMAYATQSRDEAGQEVMVAIFTAAEAFLCPEFGAGVETEIPEGSIADGTWMVGSDVEPGTYRSEGVEGCYWERLAGFSGSGDDVIVNGFPDGDPAVVTIEPTDVGFHSNNCGRWEPSD